MSALQLNVASLPGADNIARRTFANGVSGLAYENHSSPSVVVHGWLWAGSIDVAREQAGLANLVAGLLMRGTAKRTFAQINDAIESVGAAMSVGSGGHTTRFTVKCLSEDLALLLDILTDCLYAPTFPDLYVARRRGQILTALEEREQDTEAMASLRFSELLYEDHPYAASQLGYRETVERLTRDEIEAFYRAHYGARGMTVILVGAVRAEEGLDALEGAMGTWRGADSAQAPLPPVDGLEATRRVYTPILGKTQSAIVLGWPGVTRSDPDYLSAYLANCVLGQFGMMGRIGQEVRDARGLAYWVHTSLEAGLGPGPWIAAAGVAPDDVDVAIEAILGEIQRLRDEPVGAEELADNKAYIADSLPLRLEGNGGIASQIAAMELFGLGLDYLQRFPALLQAVTAEDVQAVTRRLIDPERYVLSVAGPPLKEEL
ncbi:MAG: insulinase family protein [Anaerolineae bacterium]|nr:insulinase family protein [Anaerolineae bacterium]